MTARSLDPYDVWNYPSRPFRYTRIDRLELMARLHGLAPAAPHAANVLEIGCGTGGNLLAMAQVFPGSRFVGIDIAPTQIAAGQELQRAAGLTNVELEVVDLAALGASWGEYDYIIAHGVYSWVPDAVKARLLDVIGERLVPRGVAFLSYNVKPGWYRKAAMRDIMRYHTRGKDDPRERVAQGRAVLDFLARGARAHDTAWKAILAEQAELARRISDEVVFFDFLADVNDACYFHELAAELPRRGLQYLADASFSSMVPNGIPQPAVSVLESLGSDVIGREQYLDFLGNRTFRTSLLVKADAAVTRAIDLEVARDWHLASNARPVDPSVDLAGPDPVAFEVANAVVRVAPARARRVLCDLASRYPASRPFSEIAGEHDAVSVAVEVFQLFGSNLVELWPHADAFVVDPPERPRASPLARALAARGPKAFNLRHDTVALEPAERLLLPMLDGTRDVGALAAAVPGEDVIALVASIANKALLLREP